MSTSQILQHLYLLDTSSPDFLRYLYCLIQTDEEDQYLASLQGLELTRLVDFLDEVRSAPLALVQLTRQTAQILDVGPIADDILRRCLHKLRTICSHHATLPSSYTISGDLARVGDHPIAFGGFSDVWKGTHNDTDVCIKQLRVSEQIRETLEKVSIYYRLIFPVHWKPPTVTAVLQGGDHVEKVETSKCCRLHWRCAKSLAICLGVDAEWNLDGLCQRKSRCKSGWPCGSFLCDQ